LEAVKWFQQSADKDHGDSLCNLGTLYAQGKGGLPVDIEKAMELWTRAADEHNVIEAHFMIAQVIIHVSFIHTYARICCLSV
jgi:TPR repeat protein